MSISFDTMEFIIALRRYGSLSKTAQSLYISEPALSKQIRKIEKELGFPLTKRSSSGCTLTEAGLLLANEGEKFLEQRERLVEEMRKTAGITVKEQQLRLGTANCYAESLLPKFLPFYMKEHSDVKVEILQNRTDILEKMCLDGAADMILTQTEPGNPGLKYVPIMKEETVLFIPAAYAEDNELKESISQGRLSLKQLKNYPYAELQGHLRFRSFIAPLFKEAGIVPKPIFTSESWSTVLDFIKQGMCYTVIPKLFEVPEDKIKVVSINSQQPVTRTLAFAYRADRNRLSDAEKALIQSARAKL